MESHETQREYWILMRLMRPIRTHETQKDYWRVMRTMWTVETQRV